jgi:hypothetical protein
LHGEKSASAVLNILLARDDLAGHGSPYSALALSR